MYINEVRENWPLESLKIKQAIFIPIKNPDGKNFIGPKRLKLVVTHDSRLCLYGQPDQSFIAGIRISPPTLVTGPFHNQLVMDRIFSWSSFLYLANLLILGKARLPESEDESNAMSAQTANLLAKIQKLEANLTYLTEHNKALGDRVKFFSEQKDQYTKQIEELDNLVIRKNKEIKQLKLAKSATDKTYSNPQLFTLD